MVPNFFKTLHSRWVLQIRVCAMLARSFRRAKIFAATKGELVRYTGRLGWKDSSPPSPSLNFFTLAHIFIRFMAMYFRLLLFSYENSRYLTICLQDNQRHFGVVKKKTQWPTFQIKTSQETCFLNTLLSIKYYKNDVYSA